MTGKAYAYILSSANTDTLLWLLIMGNEMDRIQRLMMRMQSIADPLRLRLLNLLEKEELGVAELCDILQLPQSTVSRHLKTLTDTNWISSRSSGTANLYHMLDNELSNEANDLWQLSKREFHDWSILKHDELRLKERILTRDPGSLFFANTATRWEDLRHELYGSRYFLDLFAAIIPENLDIVDLGCGTGEILAALKGRCASIVGVDDSEKMIRLAAKRLVEISGPTPTRVVLSLSQLDTLPLRSESADYVLMSLALCYIKEPKRAFREIYRILRPNGCAILITLLKHDREDFRRQMHQIHNGFSAKEIEELAGKRFKAIENQPIQPSRSVKGPSLLISKLKKNIR